MRKNKGKFGYIPFLYLLFLICFIGSCFGISFAKNAELLFNVPFHTNATAGSILVDCFVYHVAALLAARFSVGIVVVPLIIFVRGAVLSSTAFVMLNSMTDAFSSVLLICGLPAVLQLPSLLYISALGMWRRVQSILGRINLIDSAMVKRDIVLGLLLLLFSAAIKWIVL